MPGRPGSLPDNAGGSTLLSPSGGEKGLRGSAAASVLPMGIQAYEATKPFWFHFSVYVTTAWRPFPLPSYFPPSGNHLPL